MGQLLTDALVIKNATQANANTATRVGGWMEDAATAIETLPSALAFIDISGSQEGTLNQGQWTRMGADCTLIFQRNGMNLIDTNAGILEYTGADKWFHFSYMVALTAQSNRRIHIGLFKNEELIAGSEFEQYTGSQTEITLPGQFVLEATDTDKFSIYIKCSNGSSSYALYNLNVIVKEF